MNRRMNVRDGLFFSPQRHRGHECFDGSVMAGLCAQDNHSDVDNQKPERTQRCNLSILLGFRMRALSYVQSLVSWHRRMKAICITPCIKDMKNWTDSFPAPSVIIVLDSCRDIPDMTARINNSTHSVAPGLILWGHQDASP